MRQWAIAVGINQYQFFQPLIYAQADAEAVRAVLVSQLGVPAEQCLLLTDTSPPLFGQSTVPARGTILGWLDRLYQHYLQPGDRLWFFFSGYGVCHQGQDYLVPIDSTPTAITTTAIPVSQLLQCIQSAPVETLLILDGSRSQGSLSPEMFGAHTAQLAAVAGVPTILSCEPGQFSHETVTLGHGFFTAALLEQLQQRANLTLTGLEQGLRDRVPQLTEQYYRPPQLPLLICPAAKREQTVLAATSVTGNITSSSRAVTQAEAIGNGTGAGTKVLLPLTAAQANGYNGNGSSPQGNGQGQRAIARVPASLPQGNSRLRGNEADVTAANQATLAASARMQPGLPVQSVLNGHHHLSMSQQLPSQPPRPETSPVTLQTADAANPSVPSDPPKGGWFMWGGIVTTALLLTAGVYWRNFAAFTGRSVAVAPSPTGDRRRADLPPPTSVNKTAVNLSPAVNGGGSTNLGGMSNAISPSPVVDPPVVPKLVVPQPGNPKSVEPNVGNPKPVNPKPVTVKPVTVKPGSVGQQGTGSVPGNPKPTNTKSGNKSGQTVSPKPVRTAARPRKEIYSNQASPYWYGIQAARKVKPGNPDYQQAQQDIARWSREIWAIAQWRAGQRRYDTAIMAASLVPADQTIHQTAQQAIDRWCPGLSRYRVINAAHRRQATAICQRG